MSTPPSLLDDVVFRLQALPEYCNGLFEFEPGKTVTMSSHLQGIVRLDRSADQAPTFVMSQMHEDVNKAGFLYITYPKAVGTRGPITAANPHGPGMGKLLHFVSGGLSEHPGGMQGNGQFVVAAQDPKPDNVRAFVSLIDVADPDHTSFIAQLVLDGTHGEQSADALTCCGLLQMTNGEYLMAAYRYSAAATAAANLKLFRSKRPHLDANTQWVQHAELTRQGGLPDGFRDQFENLALLGQHNGALFLAGLGGSSTQNWIDLYSLDLTTNALTFLFTKKITTRYAAGATLRAGGSFYVTPEGALVLYVVQKSALGYQSMMIEEFYG